MTEMTIRQAIAEDALACAAIHNDWIDATPWMPRVHAPQEVEAYYSVYLLAKTRAFVVSDPIRAYLSLTADGFVSALYSARPGKGFGKALINHAKGLETALSLWTFQANTGARRFYEREGFRAMRQTDGDNEEGLPDILYRWVADDA
ncbi:MAG: GNAT family N-acetyltransferase [Pseudomonadota bacterium]